MLSTVITELRSTNSKNDKVAILSKYKDNELVREYFRMMYEPKINFFMSKIDESFATHSINEETKMDMEKLMSIHDTLHNRKLTGHKARAWIADLHESMNEDDKEILSLLIDRNAKSNFNISTINKVWPKLITDIPYMRCCLPHETSLAAFPWSQGVYSQIKADGMFSNFTYCKSGDISITTRAGTPMPLEPFSDVVNEFKNAFPKGYQAHGEFTIVKDGKVLPRHEGNGMLNSVAQGGELEDGYVLVYEIWDIIPEYAVEPKAKYSDELYSKRFSFIVNALKDSVHLRPIDYRIVYSIQEAYNHYKEALEEGKEGTIIKNPNMIWEDTTSKNQVKLKLEFECEIKITGFKPGTGKNKKTFGSLEGESSDGLVKLSITGFKDDERLKIFKEMDTYINAIATVRSNCIMTPTPNKKHHSLYLPRIIELRRDKTEADDLPRIISQYEAAISASNIAKT